MNDSRAASLLFFRDDSTGFTIGLTKYQIQRIINGCSSVNITSSLVTLGLTHGLAKKFYNHAPDSLTRWVQLERNGSVHPSNYEHLVGPSKPLTPSLMRVVILRCKFMREDCTCEPYHQEFGCAQPGCWLDGTMGKYKVVDEQFHVLYDLTGVCIVSSTGQCMLIEKEHLTINPNKTTTTATTTTTTNGGGPFGGKQNTTTTTTTTTKVDTAAFSGCKRVEQEDELEKFDNLIATLTDKELGVDEAKEEEKKKKKEPKEVEKKKKKELKRGAVGDVDKKKTDEVEEVKGKKKKKMKTSYRAEKVKYHRNRIESDSESEAEDEAKQEDDADDDDGSSSSDSE